MQQFLGATKAPHLYTILYTILPRLEHLKTLLQLITGDLAHEFSFKTIRS